MSIGMKKIVFLLLFIPVFCFSQIDVSKQVKESVLRLKVLVLQDSIAKLNQRPVMTKAQFVKLYKYERLEKYYKICKRKPTQWKYYKGWSTRVFEL